MLSSGSTRLAATLLLALLLGTTIRAWRKSGATSLPAVPAAQAAPVDDTPRNSFPDE